MFLSNTITTNFYVNNFFMLANVSFNEKSPWQNHPNRLLILKNRELVTFYKLVLRAAFVLQFDYFQI